MYDYISGQITFKSENYLVLENQGVGYKIYTSLRTFQSLSVSKEIKKVFIYQHVREDELTLYGFSSRYDRDVFLSLLSVSGIGPKLALKILTEVDPPQLVKVIYNEDMDNLKKVKGLGAKTAGKALLELKGKLDHLITPNTQVEKAAGNTEIVENTKNALKNLGYRESEVKQVVAVVFEQDPPKTLEEAIKKTLIHLSKG